MYSKMILKSRRHKIELKIDDDFNMGYANMLIKYDTYLLYDVRLKLKSIDAYKAINHFFDKVGNDDISSKFFRGINAHVDYKSYEIYNDFVLKYSDLKFKLDRLNPLPDYENTKKKEIVQIEEEDESKKDEDSEESKEYQLSEEVRMKDLNQDTENSQEDEKYQEHLDDQEGEEEDQEEEGRQQKDQEESEEDEEEEEGEDMDRTSIFEQQVKEFPALEYGGSIQNKKCFQGS